MATHGTERQAERDRDYAREELGRLQVRCGVMEQQLLEMGRRISTLENFITRLSPPR